MFERYPLMVELGCYYSEVVQGESSSRVSSQFTMGRVGVTMTFC